MKSNDIEINQIIDKLYNYISNVYQTTLTEISMDLIDEDTARTYAMFNIVEPMLVYIKSYLNNDESSIDNNYAFLCVKTDEVVNNNLKAFLEKFYDFSHVFSVNNFNEIYNLLFSLIDHFSMYSIHAVEKEEIFEENEKDVVNEILYISKLVIFGVYDKIEKALSIKSMNELKSYKSNVKILRLK